MKYILYKTLKYSLKPFFRLLFLPKYVGVENIPSKGAFVFAGNHTSGVDAAMMVSTPKRVIHMLSKKELFNTGIEFKKGIWFEDVEFIYRILPNIKNIKQIIIKYYAMKFKKMKK